MCLLETEMKFSFSAVGIGSSLLKQVKVSSRSELMNGAHSFVNRCNDVANACKMRSAIEDMKVAISQLATSVFGGKVQVYLYGSRYTGLALEDSDVDLYVNIGEQSCSFICTEVVLC